MHEDMQEEIENLESEEVSKSQIKRELLELQKIAERLTGMSPAQRAPLPLTPVMLDALEEAKRIKSHNAMRRHIRRIAKLLRNEELDAIHALLDRIDNRHMEENRRFHQLERWRDRLLEEGDDALAELLAECPHADRQHLRQLLRAAKKEQENGKPPASARKIFRYLKELNFI